MEIRIRFHDLDRSQALVDHATQRIEHFLGRLGRAVSRAVLHVTDVNGPRGGRDKRCHLAVSGPSIGTVSLTEAHEDPFAAVELVLYRARRTLAQHLDRSRAHDGETIRRGPIRLRLVPGASG